MVIGWRSKSAVELWPLGRERGEKTKEKGQTQNRKFPVNFVSFFVQEEERKPNRR